MMIAAEYRQRRLGGKAHELINAQATNLGDIGLHNEETEKTKLCTCHSQSDGLKGVTPLTAVAPLQWKIPGGFCLGFCCSFFHAPKAESLTTVSLRKWFYFRQLFTGSR